MQDAGYEGFEYAPETKVDIFQPYVEQLLRLLGFEPEEYWLSDESIDNDLSIGSQPIKAGFSI